MHSLEIKLGAQFVDFSQHPLERPERRIGWAIGAAASKLIVENHWALVTQRVERFQIIVGESKARGAAINDQ